MGDLIVLINRPSEAEIIVILFLIYIEQAVILGVKADMQSVPLSHYSIFQGD